MKMVAPDIQHYSNSRFKNISERSKVVLVVVLVIVMVIVKVKVVVCIDNISNKL